MHSLVPVSCELAAARRNLSVRSGAMWVLAVLAVGSAASATGSGGPVNYIIEHSLDGSTFTKRFVSDVCVCGCVCVCVCMVCVCVAVRPPL